MADITIRGAGIFGLSIAWACARRGATVQVIDPNGPGAGASGGILGALAPHVPENWNAKKAFQLESLVMAGPFWSGVEAAGGVGSGYGRTGRVQPIADVAALDLARRRAQTAKELWRDTAKWEVIPVGEAGPWCPPSASGFVIRDTLSARIHPRRACAAIAAALAARGISCTPDGTDHGKVIHATGVAGLAELNQHFGKIVGTGVKGQAALLHHDAGTAPQLFAETLHFIPHDDATVAIGSTSEREFDAGDVTDDLLEALIAKAMALMPLLHGARVVQRWSGVRPRAKSRAPMLGAHPVYPGQFIANGGFKIGFGMAPKVAEVMADLMLEDKDTIPEAFRPEASL